MNSSHMLKVTICPETYSCTEQLTNSEADRNLSPDWRTNVFKNLNVLLMGSGEMQLTLWENKLGYYADWRYSPFHSILWIDIGAMSFLRFWFLLGAPPKKTIKRFLTWPWKRRCLCEAGLHPGQCPCRPVFTLKSNKKWFWCSQKNNDFDVHTRSI